MKHEIKRKVLWGTLLVVTVAALFGVFTFRPSAPNDSPAVPPEVEVDTRPHLTATRVVGRSQGERQFELDAGAIADDDDWVRIDEIENGVLYRDGQVFVTFDAAAGRWHRPSNNLVLVGDVVLVYDERVHMRTDELEWHARDELVVAPGSVQMVIDGDTVEADRMQADLDTERVHLVGNVRIVRATGDTVDMAEVVYWLAEDKVEGFGQGRLVFGGQGVGHDADYDPGHDADESPET